MRHHRFTDLAPGPGPLRRTLVRVLEVTAAVAMVALLVIGAVTALQRHDASGGPGGDARPAAGHQHGRVHALPTARETCSAHGFDPGTPASTAVVRTPSGEVRLVSFARGWDVFRGERPGTLVAVCVPRAS